MALDKLMIGTVNFGLPYGSVPGSGQVPEEQASAIVAEAVARGIDRFDTAAGYGSAETVLGHALERCHAPDPKIVTKVLPLDDGPRDAAAVDAVIDRIRQSCELLGIQSLDALLVHRASDLLGDDGEWLWGVLQKVRADGLVRRIGVSVYEAEEIDGVCARFQPDTVQLPLSIADQRLIQSGHLSKLAGKGIDIVARSVFLQGVLLNRLQDVDPIFSRAAEEVAALDDMAADLGVDRLDLCLAFVSQLPEVTHVLVGVNTVEQLRALTDAAGRNVTLPPVASERCAWRAHVLLNPSNWESLRSHSLPEAS